MKSKIFDSFNTVCIMRFVPPFKMFCDTNSVHTGAVLWMLHFSINSAASKAVNTRIAFRLEVHRHQDERMVASFRNTINYLL